MLEQMTGKQFGEWSIMLDRWNMGEYPAYRTDVAAAKIAEVIANIYAPRGKQFKPDDFMPVFKPKAGPMPVADLRQGFLNMARRGRPPRTPKRDKATHPQADKT